MSRLSVAGQPASHPDALGRQLRQLREQSGEPCWKVAAAAEMDSSLLSKIETGKRSPTASQLAKLAAFFKVALHPLESRRIAEEVRRKYAASPHFESATAILREEAGEYRVSNPGKTVNKPAKPVNNRKRQK